MKENIIGSPVNKKSKCKTVIFLGDNEVGKTSILQRFIKNKFEEIYFSTIGIDYYSKDVQYQSISISLSIWDTNGLEGELRLLPSYVYKAASSYIIVCSYDSKESYESLKKWISHIENFLSCNSMPILILINKCDITNRKFQFGEVISLFEDYHRNFWIYEVSARENKTIDCVFEKISEIILGKAYSNNTQKLSLNESNSTADTCSINRRGSFIIKEDVRKKKCCAEKVFTCCK